MDEPGLGAQFAAALAVWLAMLVTPGPDFAATVHASAGGSRGRGLAVAAGVTVGMAAWATASLFGLQAALVAFEGLATAVRLAGALYLTYIGVRLVWAAWRGDGSTGGGARGSSLAGGFRLGLLTNLANPKALAIFASLFAALVPPGAPAWFTVGLLAAVIATTAGWYALVAIALSTGAVARCYRRVERGITALTGALFAGIGARLAAER